MKRFLLMACLTVATVAGASAGREEVRARIPAGTRLPHPVVKTNDYSKRMMGADLRASATADARKAAVMRAMIMAMAEGSTEGLWMPGKITESFNMGDDEWLAASEVTREYDEKGRVIMETVYEMEDDWYFVADATYNDAENSVESVLMEGESLETLELVQRHVRTTDARMPQLITKSYYYNWDQDAQDWVIAFPSYHRVVDRDDAGNVTAIHYFSLYSTDNEFVEVQKLEIGYGSEGKPSSVTESILSYDDSGELVWQEAYKVYDCTWYTTDGQIWNLDAIFEGGNRVKSYSQAFEGEYEASMEVAFVGDTEDFTCTASYPDATSSVQVWTNFSNDGYRNVVNFYEDPEDSEAVYSIIENQEFDAYENVELVYYIEVYEGEPMVYSWEEGDSEYDDEGRLMSYTHRMFIPSEDEPEWGDDDDFMLRPSRTLAFDAPPCEGEWYEDYRLEYADYIDCSTLSVDAIQALPASSETFYFTIDGRRLPAPVPGIVIRHRGGKAEKLIVR